MRGKEIQGSRVQFEGLSSTPEALEPIARKPLPGAEPGDVPEQAGDSRGDIDGSIQGTRREAVFDRSSAEEFGRDFQVHAGGYRHEGPIATEGGGEQA